MAFDEPKIIHTTYESYYGVSNEFESYTNYEYSVCPYCESEYFEERGDDNMERKIIDLNNCNLSFKDIDKIEGYIWKDNILIPVEMIEGE